MQNIDDDADHDKYVVYPWVVPYSLEGRDDYYIQITLVTDGDDDVAGRRRRLQHGAHADRGGAGVRPERHGKHADQEVGAAPSQCATCGGWLAAAGL